MNSKPPKILFHGSTVKGIKRFEPLISKGYGEKFGPLVYATQHLPVAIVFTLNTKFPMFVGVSNGVVYVLIVSTKEEFARNDTGGMVYVFSSKGFNSDPARGMGNFEWASATSVEPIDTIEIFSTLKSMLENKVQVYFIDQKTFEKVEVAQDHGLLIASSLVSENMKENINSLKIPNKPS